jgi:ribosomal protein L22
MAESKDTEKKGTTKAAAKKPAAKKPAAKKAPAKKPAASKASSSKASTTKAKPSSSKKPAAKTSGKTGTAAKGKAGTAKADTTASKRKAADAEAPQRPVVKARARYVRIAPRKARLIADQVRGMPLMDARTLLRFSSRGAATDIAKLIDSAAANAENNHDLVADDLVIKDIHVDEGPTLRRYRPRALGRATRINKRTSHINVALTPED